MDKQKMENSEVISWLLEKDNPPVRYLVLRDLLKRPAEDIELIEAKEHLMEYEVTQGILKHLPDLGDQKDNRAYWKYTGKYWQMNHFDPANLMSFL